MGVGDSDKKNQKTGGKSVHSSGGHEVRNSNKKKANGFTTLLTILAIIFGLAMLGISILFSLELENQRNTNPKKCNKPAGEFAVEPSASVKSGVLNECTVNDQKNQPCVYSANNINEAINQCNRLADICYRFVFNSETRYMEIIGLNIGFENIIVNPNASIYTRQIGVTYSGSGSNNNTNSGGFSSKNVSFNNVSSSSISSSRSVTGSSTVTGGYTGGSSGGSSGGYY